MNHTIQILPHRFWKTSNPFALAMLLASMLATWGHPNTYASEPWKGARMGSPVQIGVSGGTSSGFGYTQLGFNGLVSALVLKDGFIPDINNEVFAEASFGPFWNDTGKTWQYSAGLRWEFGYSAQWSFFALAGLGGGIYVPSSGASNLQEFYPRIGLGALFFPFEFPLGYRIDIGRELTGFGAVYYF